MPSPEDPSDSGPGEEDPSDSLRGQVQKTSQTHSGARCREPSDSGPGAEDPSDSGARCLFFGRRNACYILETSK